MDASSKVALQNPRWRRRDGEGRRENEQPSDAEKREVAESTRVRRIFCALPFESYFAVYICNTRKIHAAIYDAYDHFSIYTRMYHINICTADGRALTRARARASSHSYTPRVHGIPSNAAARRTCVYVCCEA